MNAKSACMVVAMAVFLLPPTPAAAQNKPAEPQEVAAAEQPFAAMAGSWSGGGTISLNTGARERLRCRANHSVGQGGRSLSLNIRCASDSYNINLSSNVVQRRGRIYGSWSESSNGFSGSVSGTAVGGRVRALAKGNGFAAGLAITTRGGHQSIAITPHATFITGVHISLRKR